MQTIVRPAIALPAQPRTIIRAKLGIALDIQNLPNGSFFTPPVLSGIFVPGVGTTPAAFVPAPLPAGWTLSGNNLYLPVGFYGITGQFYMQGGNITGANASMTIGNEPRQEWPFVPLFNQYGIVPIVKLFSVTAAGLPIRFEGKVGITSGSAFMRRDQTFIDIFKID